MPTAQDIYAAAQALSLPERLRLAALLLDEMTSLAPPQVDLSRLDGYNDFWTEEDIADLQRYSASQFSVYDSAASEAAASEQDDALPPLEELLKMRSEQNLEPERI